MQARDIMTRPVITVRPETSVRDAAAVLTTRQITAAPVVDDEGRLIGMVSEGDLITGRFPQDPRSHARRGVAEAEPAAPQAVGQVMTTTTVAMPPATDAAELAETMLLYDIRSIPIVEGSTVVGIVSRRDLLRTLVRDDDVVATEVTRRLQTYTGDQTPWEVTATGGQVHIYGQVDDGAEERILLILARTVPGVTQAHLHRRDAAQH